MKRECHADAQHLYRMHLEKNSQRRQILKSLDRTREIYNGYKRVLLDKRNVLFSNQRRGYPDHEELQKRLMHLLEIEAKNDKKRRTLVEKIV